MSRRLAPAAGSARSFSHSPKPPYGAPARRLRVSSPARTRSTTTVGGVTYDVARQILMGHGRCVKIWPQLRLTKAWSRRAEARGSCRALGRPVMQAISRCRLSGRGPFTGPSLSPDGLSMKPITRFALEKHDGPYETWPLRSRVSLDGKPTDISLPGYTLLHQ